MGSYVCCEHVGEASQEPALLLWVSLATPRIQKSVSALVVILSSYRFPSPCQCVLTLWTLAASPGNYPSPPQLHNIGNRPLGIDNLDLDAL